VTAHVPTSADVEQAMSHAGSVVRTATALGINSRTFERQLRRYPELAAAVDRGRVAYQTGLPEPEHGTGARYKRKAFECRCEKCRSANTELAAKYRRARSTSAATPPTHGVSTYSNWGCRCDICVAAHADACRERHQRRREAS
jgi:hypothetical protein